MDVRLTVIGRVENRWQVRLVFAGGVPDGLTVGLVAESGAALGPAVVAAGPHGDDVLVELRGPCTLQPGTFVRCVAHGGEGATDTFEIGLDRRHGLHAYLHADGRLPVDSRVVGASLSPAETERLARVFPWILGCPDDDAPAAPPGVPGDELLDMLREEFDVDVDELDEETRDSLKR